MALRKWNELSARTRRLVAAGAVVEGALKVAALVDLSRRPAVAPAAEDVIRPEGYRPPDV
jgi:hypothetical protein